MSFCCSARRKSVSLDPNIWKSSIIVWKVFRCLYAWSSRKESSLSSGTRSAKGGYDRRMKIGRASCRESVEVAVGEELLQRAQRFRAQAGRGAELVILAPGH